MTETTQLSRRRQLELFVGRRVAYLQAAYLDQTRSEGRAWLAELRNSDPEPGASPNTWLVEFEGFPKDLIVHSDTPSRAERAAHLAFTLYAIHQQAQSTPMHQIGLDFGLGRAVALLQRRKPSSEPMGKLPTRFAALGTASSFDEVSHYARQLITQLRAAGLPLDYGTLAGQLFTLQHASSANTIRREWGRDFAAASTPSSATSPTPDQKEA
ncbi:MAG: type I-E CRISPR-associated protein Cse2/CasB [Propionibacteriaceae bacterium]|jgi:CRISPR system Cascade subunit CasB|nr:type I-E CRISPR-associated protein Cse2/CasB [Propionibacteriaceae bacterium]